MNCRLLITVAAAVVLLRWGFPAQAETLSEAWAHALAMSPQIAAAHCETAASEHALQAARAQRYPTAGIRGSYSVLSNEPSFIINDPLLPPGGVRFPYEQNEFASAEALVNAPLYTSGKTKYSILRSEADLAASQQELHRTRQALLLAVGEAYIAVLRAQREMEVGQQDVLTRQALQSEVDNLFKQARVPETDLLTAQVTLASAVQNHLRQQHGLEVLRAAYNQRLGRPLLTQFALEELSLPWLPQGFAELEQIAWQSRPEIVQLRALANARLNEAMRLEATQLPQVSAQGRNAYEENRFQSPNNIASAAIVVEWNPFDGGRAKHAAQTERAHAAATLRLLDDLQSRVSLELLRAWNDRQEAMERRDVTLRAIQQSDENVRVLQLRYGQGLVVQSELLDAQRRRTETARDYYSAVYDLMLAELRLRYASGMLEYSAL